MEFKGVRGERRGWVDLIGLCRPHMGMWTLSQWRVLSRENDMIGCPH